MRDLAGVVSVEELIRLARNRQSFPPSVMDRNRNKKKENLLLITEDAPGLPIRKNPKNVIKFSLTDQARSKAEPIISFEINLELGT